MTNEQLTILFGSKTRVKLLRHFLRDPGQKYYVRELTRMLNDHINAIRHELGNLETAGLVSKKKSQGKLYYRLNQGAPGINELKLLFTDQQTAPAQVEEVAQRQFSGVRAAEAAPAPELGDIRLLIQNGKFVGSQEAPADLLIVGELDDDLFSDYLKGLENRYGEIKYTVMTETEYVYRRQLFDRFITLMLSHPNKIVINRLKDRQLVRVS